MWPIILIDARAKTPDSPGRNSELRRTRVSELDHRRLQASPPPLHDQPSCIPRQQQLHGREIACALHLTKDIRATCGAARVS